MKVDVLISGGGNDVTRALMQATKTVPIVITAGSDAVARGLISSLARPGGNVTGLTSLWDELTGKRLELLKERDPEAYTRCRAVALRRWTADTVEGESSRGAAVESAAPFHGDTYRRRFGKRIQRSRYGA
jgi:hypothetical protein